MRRALYSVGKIQQLADRDLRFARVASPFGDRIGNAILEFKQTLADSDKRHNSPKTFCSAEDGQGAVDQAAVGIMLEDYLAPLHNQHRSPTFALGIFGGARAIG